MELGGYLRKVERMTFTRTSAESTVTGSFAFRTVSVTVTVIAFCRSLASDALTGAFAMVAFIGSLTSACGTVTSTSTV
jgi:hypothetical protein